MRERPDLALLLRWEQEHLEQVARKQRFLAAHPGVLIRYSMQARGWIAAWQRDRSLIAAEYDLRTLMNLLEKLGRIAEQRHARGQPCRRVRTRAGRTGASTEDGTGDPGRRENARDGAYARVLSRCFLRHGSSGSDVAGDPLRAVQVYRYGGMRSRVARGTGYSGWCDAGVTERCR